MLKLLAWHAPQTAATAFASTLQWRFFVNSACVDGFLSEGGKHVLRNSF